MQLMELEPEHTNIRTCAIELGFLGAMQGCFGFNLKDCDKSD
jgi:hypothetical protein